MGTRSQPNDITIKGTHKDQYIGTVVKVVRGRDNVKGDDPSGLDAVVLKDDRTKTLRIIYQGSQGSWITGKDWADNDWPLFYSFLNPTGGQQMKGVGGVEPSPKFPPPQRPRPTPQLVAAARLAKRVLRQYPQYRLEMYGHSLGSMDGQYALAALNKEEAARVRGAWLYEGPNISFLLNKKERNRASRYGDRVRQYVDSKDVVPFGASRMGMVGKIYHVDSRFQWRIDPFKHISDQHMWGGYKWTNDGSVVMEQKTIDSIYQQSMDRVSRLHSRWTKTGKHLTSSQTIYLDYQQVVVIVRACDEQMDRFEYELKATRERWAQSAEDLWNRTISDIANLSALHLSHGDIVDIATQEGYSKQRYIKQTTESLVACQHQASAIHKRMSSTGERINRGVNRLLEKDKRLAAQFRHWDTL